MGDGLKGQAVRKGDRVVVELPQRVPQPAPAAGPFHGGRPSAAPAKDFGAGPLGLRRRRLLFTLTNRAEGSIISFTDAKCESVWMQ